MSRRTIETTVTETRRSTVVKCDLCGVETKPNHGWSGKESFDRPETRIECITGQVFPEGDFRTRARLDVCPRCFEARLIPTIELAFGVVFERSDVEL